MIQTILLYFMLVFQANLQGVGQKIPPEGFFQKLVTVAKAQGSNSATAAPITPLSNKKPEGISPSSLPSSTTPPPSSSEQGREQRGKAFKKTPQRSDRVSDRVSDRESDQESNRGQSAAKASPPLNQNSANATKQKGKAKRELSKAESLKCEEFQGSEFERGYIEFSVPCSNALFCFASSEILRNYCEDSSRLVRYLCDPNQVAGWLTEVISCPKLCKSGKCI